MTETQKCERCGDPLPEGALRGQCPRCLLEVGLEQTSGSSEDSELTRMHGDETFAPEGTAPAGVRMPAAIGRYKILRLIGEGGMGAVYEAEQEQPRRTVALKVIKPGLASPQLLHRFEQEAQALGRLQHPGIAQIYEAGTADAGFGPQPYFAMEFIRGATLREYVDQHHLSTRDRLEMIAKVAEAVNHAHQRGLIHRDLKPGNILVDETGQPKILDFGVARVTDSDAQATMQTDVGQLVGTLAYMSPEQVLADPLELDTRSDVYALGVILYELLASKLPYEISKNLHETLQAIREEDPAKLSSINRTYRGDIETIVAKALEKDKTRRYASAADLAADIRHYLNDEPIVARPPTTTYQLQKFARRHKALVVGVAAVFVVLVGGVVVSTTQMLRARDAERAATVDRDHAVQAEKQTASERDRANQNENKASRERDRAVDAEAQARQEADTSKALNDFLQKDLLAVANPAAQMAGRADAPANADLKVREALDRAAQRIEGRFEKQPLVEAELHETIGTAYEGLGVYDKAEPHLMLALDLRRRIQGESHPSTVNSMVLLATLDIRLRKLGQAETLLTTALAICNRTLGKGDPKTLQAMSALAALYVTEQRNTEAEELLNKVETGQKRLLGANDPQTLMTQVTLAMLYKSKGQLARSEEMMATVEKGAKVLERNKNPGWQAVVMMTEMWRNPTSFLTNGFPSSSGKAPAAPDEVTLATITKQLGQMQTYANQRQFEKAEELGTRLVEGARRLSGPESQISLAVSQMLGIMLATQGKFDRAEPLMRDALAVQLRTLGEFATGTQNAMAMLAQIYVGQAKYPEAAETLAKLLAIQRQRLGYEDPKILDTMVILAFVYRRTGQAELSRNLFGELGETPKVLASMSSVASDYRRDAPEVAEEILTRLLEIQRRALGVDNQDTRVTMVALANVWSKEGKYPESEALFAEVRDVQRRLSLRTINGLNTICSLGWSQLRQRKFADAEATFREALSNLAWAAPNTWEWARYSCQSMLGASLAAQRKYTEAEALLVSSYDEMNKLVEPTPPVESRFTVEDAGQSTIDMYQAWGKPEKVVEWRRKLQERKSSPALPIVAPQKPPL